MSNGCTCSKRPVGRVENLAVFSSSGDFRIINWQNGKVKDGVVASSSLNIHKLMGGI